MAEGINILSVEQPNEDERGLHLTSVKRKWEVSWFFGEDLVNTTCPVFM